MNALDVASYFIHKGIYDGNPISNLKVQKLIYIAHGLHLAIFKEPLIKSPIQAWQYGPVIPVVYEYLKPFGAKDISITTLKNPIETKEDFLTSDQKALLEKVWQIYGSLTAFQLVDITHQEGSPWHITFWSSYYKAPILNEVIKTYYENLIEQRKSQTTKDGIDKK